VVSGRTGAALRAQADRLAAFVNGHPELDPAAVGRALGTTRTAFERRAVVWGARPDEHLAGLTALTGQRKAANLVQGAVRPPGTVAALFSGQGAQRAGMGRELYERFPVFARSVDESCAVLDGLLGRSVREVMFTDTATDPDADAGVGGLLDRTVYTQAALFVFEVALFRLVEAAGVRVDVLVGHSVGEVAAAHVAGVLSLADACALVAARGRLMQALPAGGAMVAVQAGEEQVVPLLAGREGEVSLAAVNAPGATVLSGVAEAVQEIAAVLAREGCKTRRLRVSHAFHSPLMEPMLEDFARVVEGLSFTVPRIPIVSTVSGRAGEDLTDPGYWVRQVRCPVRFADAVAALAGEGVTDTLEVGPDAVLTPAAGQSAGEEVRTVALQRRDRGESAALLAGLGELWTNGTHVDWNTLTTHRTGDRTTTTAVVGLPTYAFQHQPYWLDEVAATSVVGETAEAFWAAARGGDVTAAAAALGLPAGASLADIVTVLAAGPAAAPSFGTAGTSGAPQDTVDPAVLLKERLANAPDGERHGIVLAVVRSEAAAVLALPGAEDLDTRAELLDLGFSSLMAVELRNQLGAITGVQVPPTLVYDYPSAHDVATFLCDALAA